MNAQEKKDLRGKIMTSVDAHKRKTRRRNYYVSAAATILILVSIGFYTYDMFETSSQQLVAYSQAMDVEPSGEVQLIVEGSQTITLEKNTSSISYAPDGSGIAIEDSSGSLKKIAIEHPDELNTLVVPFGTTSSVVLSDGTRVWLNSGSRLIYPAAFNGNQRAIYLEGEAIFDVTHNPQQPFKVLSEDHTVEVLGTVFSVSNYSDEASIQTVLKSGKVKISHPSDSFFQSQHSTEILPGTMAVYNKSTPGIETKKVDVDPYFSWREGVLILKNNSLKEIMRKLGRYYDVTIAFEELHMEEATFSGHLSLQNSVEGVLEILQETSDFQYTLSQNGTIKITRHEKLIRDQKQKRL